jgi:hypothetical protein
MIADPHIVIIIKLIILRLRTLKRATVVQTNKEENLF